MEVAVGSRAGRSRQGAVGVGLALALTLGVGCSSGGDGRRELIVLAAASMQDAVREAGEAFALTAPELDVVIHYGGSGLLAQQIVRGAPASVFVSAGWGPARRVEQRLGVQPDGVPIARNRLVVVVPERSRWRTASAGELLGSPELERLALGHPDSVPAGSYARDALRASGLWEPLLSKLIYASDVRQGLMYAESSEVDASIVYATDVRVAPGVVVLGEVPGGEAVAIEAVAMVIDPADPRARGFVEFLAGESGRAILGRHGFLPTSS